ncbi:CYFA0S04e06172g1_1 [Cyberlindnera fabianii]|uniref:Guanine-nucleotide exchange factor YEL1 n=1 Tax=Cyberlindnera fabianii TaxID=36022 RepID=A0A061ARM2_CYBFA|nr:Guanine-nucleotide exchange factor YEL1 [Cyberlindnera fabianii]CDR40219.1 CYFA0S04e06172g1_1 [Cyberlindnera fabianii]
MDSVITEVSPTIRPSPNLQNIHEIYQNASTSSTKSTTPRKLNFDVTADTISEEPEEDQTDASAHSLRVAKQIKELKYTEIPVEEYASFIGTQKPENLSICEQFMRLFQWPASLIKALRLLCSSLYLVGEAQQIDQILEVFAKSWSQAHPRNNIGDYKAIHIVCFSLFILNSDLHNQGNQESKFTKEEFVDNTLQAIKEEKEIKTTDDITLGEELRVFFDSLNSEQLEILPLINMKVRQNKGKRVATPPKRDVSNVSLVSNKNNKRLSSIGTPNLSRVNSIRRMSSFTEPVEVNYDVNYKKDQFDDKLEKLGPPWTIEGLMKSEKATGRHKKKNSWFGWLTGSSTISPDLDIYSTKDLKQSIVIIAKGLLKQYSFDSTADRKNFIKTRQDKYVNTVVTYNLYSATARLVDENMITNSKSSTSGVTWVLTIPNLLTNDYTQDKKIVYYAASEKIASDFVETCNFWAARITSIPSSEEEMVTNQEFGWSNDVLIKNKGLEKVRLHPWKCLLSIESSFIPSAFELQDQFTQMKRYVESISLAIETHNKLKPVLQRVWGENKMYEKQFDLVMSNWSEKYVYLLKQKQKYGTYMDSLALALSFKASKV